MAGCHSFPLFLFIFHIFITYIHSFIQSHSYNTFIHRHSLRPLSISPLLVRSVGNTSLWCWAENWTRACLTASRRATNWATTHHYWAMPHCKLACDLWSLFSPLSPLSSCTASTVPCTRTPSPVRCTCTCSQISLYSSLQRKSHLCIPFLGIARPQPQFPHSCVCEQFI